MSLVFADACYWIALFNPHDQLHAKARQSQGTLGECRLVTSEMVLTEFLNSLAGKGVQIRGIAVQVVNTILANPNIEVVPQSSKQFQEACKWYQRYNDKEWGITDCASMQIMEERRIQQILTNDRHFEQAGFQALMR